MNTVSLFSAPGNPGATPPPRAGVGQSQPTKLSPIAAHLARCKADDDLESRRRAKAILDDFFRPPSPAPKPVPKHGPIIRHLIAIGAYAPPLRDLESTRVPADVYGGPGDRDAELARRSAELESEVRQLGARLGGLEAEARDDLRALAEAVADLAAANGGGR